MMGAHIHTKAADIAMLPGDDKLSPAASATAGDTAVTEPVDFGATLQGLIASDQQEAPFPTAENTIAPASYSDEASPPVAVITASISASERPTNRAWASVLSADATRTAPTPVYVGIPSAEAARAFQVATYSFEQLRAAKESPSKSAPADLNLPSGPKAANSAETASLYAGVPRWADSHKTPSQPLTLDLRLTSAQKVQDPVSSSGVSPQRRLSSSATTHSFDDATSYDDSLASSNVAFVASAFQQLQSPVTTERFKSADPEPSSVTSRATRSQTKSSPSADVKVEPRTLPTAAADEVNKSLNVDLASNTRVHETNLRQRMDLADVPVTSIAAATPTMRARSATTQVAENSVIPEESSTTTPITSDFVDSGNRYPASPASPASSANREPAATKDDAGKPSIFQRLLPPDKNSASLKPPAVSGSLEVAALNVPQSNAAGTSGLQVAVTARLVGPTKATPHAPNAPDSKPSSSLRVDASIDSEGYGLAFSASQNSRSSVLTETEEPAGHTSVGLMDHAVEEAPEHSAATSSGRIQSPSLKSTRTESNSLDQFPEQQVGQPQTLARNVSATKAGWSNNSPETTASTLHDAAPDSASTVSDEKQATVVKSRNLVILDHSHFEGERSPANGAAESRRDGVVNRGLAPTVSSGAKYLASDATATVGIVGAQEASQLPQPSDAARPPDESRQSELAGASDSTTGATQATSTAIADLSQSNTRRSTSPKVSVPEQTGAAILTGHTSGAEAIAAYQSVKADSLKPSDSNDRTESASGAGSSSSLRQARGEIREDDYTTSNSSASNTAISKVVATYTSDDANPAEPPGIEMSQGLISLGHLESPAVTASAPGTTQAADRLGTTPFQPNPPALGQSTRTANSAGRSAAYEDPMAVDTHAAVSGAEQELRKSASVSDSAASDIKSFGNNSSGSFASATETHPVSASSTEVDAHQGHISGNSVAAEASSLSFHSTSAPAAEHAQPEPNDPSSLTALRPVAKAQTTSPSPALEIVSSSGEAHPVSRGTESAPIKLVEEATPSIEAGRVADLKIQLADGQTAHATVRERAGSVDVKIVTSTSASAQRVSGEIDSMRQNLDAAGLRLGHSEVSYQQGSGGSRGGEEYQRAPQTSRGTDKQETFTLNEVVE